MDCETCTQVYNGKPPCSTCFPGVLPQNEMALEIWSLVSFNPTPDSVLQLANMYGLDPVETLNKVCVIVGEIESVKARRISDAKDTRRR